MARSPLLQTAFVNVHRALRGLPLTGCPTRFLLRDMTSAAPAPAAAPEPAQRVLVIDDEPNVASFVGRALRAKGFAVDVALGGERGIEAGLEGGEALIVLVVVIRGLNGLEGVNELIVLDLRMRDVNGLVILRQVMRARPEQPVLVLSAASDVEVKVP